MTGIQSPDLETRLRQMEDLNRRMAERIDSLVGEVQTLRQQVGNAGTTGEGVAARTGATPPDSRSSTSLDSARSPSTPNYAGLSGTRVRPKAVLIPTFGPGFQLESENEEFQLQFHQETQIDYREFNPNGEEFARSGFYAPRLRAFFTGRVTKNMDYMFSVNKGYGEFNVLDAWVNFHKGDKLQLKVGRFMTPFNYEQFAVQNMWLITPERSVFTQNLGLNRQIGGMLWGFLFDNKLDYALGVFDGPRNSFQDYNESKDIFAYLNGRPFRDQPDGSLLKNLNIGGSFVYGSQDNPLRPNAFRVAANASNDAAANQPAPPFMLFNDPNITRELGQRTFWSGTAAYFYKGLSVIADYNGGILSYAPASSPDYATKLPVHGYSVAAGYFVTGEHIDRRTIVDPIRPLNLNRGEFALGAVELIAGFSNFWVDRAIFTSGLSDPDKWSNEAWTTNIGLNWYPNRYLKFYLDWQHAEFGNPVFYATGKKSLANDLYWFRVQSYF